MPEKQQASWGELLRDAVEKPGRMLEAYSAFHNYSFGNALLALEQCTRRGLRPGPLNTYRGWTEWKRQVRKGEKAITLCMPMPFKRAAQTDNTKDEPTEPQTSYAFRFRAYWFVLAQTEGEEAYSAPIPRFDLDASLLALNITRTPFDEMNGNIQGFANGRAIAINPLAALPQKTTFHEMAHILLGHTTTERLVDSEQTPRHIREVEAESVALICCESLGLDGAEFCRGYIQHWLKSEKEISNHCAARIFVAATSILKAGTTVAGSQ
ncbi:MAG: ArdC-like ssDNA-binding domain-containing protein [Candidatus Acidiferrum sp.]